MRDFENSSNTNRDFDKFYNNNYHSNEGYSANDNCNNDRCTVNRDYNNNYNYDNDRYSTNSAYNNYPNKNDENLNDLEEFFKKYKKQRTISTILFFIFFIIIAVFFAIGITTDDPKLKDQATQIFGYVFLGVCILSGVGLLLYPSTRRYIKKKRCKHLLKATVIGLKEERVYTEKYDGGHQAKSAFPQYEFYYMGKTYRVMEKSSRNFALPKIGSQVDMLINEENPYDFYVDEKSEDILFIVVGLMFFIGSISYIFS